MFLRGEIHRVSGGLTFRSMVVSWTGPSSIVYLYLAGNVRHI